MPHWLPSGVEAACVALGGSLGALARLTVARGLLAAGVGDPWPTAAINLGGSFVLGVLVVACRDRPGLLMLLGTGFCGGFTTFSTFGVDTARLLATGRYGTAAAYALVSAVGAVAGAALGERLALGARAG